MEAADERRGPGEPGREEMSADRRTQLALERTQLAWWRTGLTSLAVAIGVGRVVPELSDSKTSWPYAAVGIAFALYGIALFWQGTRQGPRGSRHRALLAATGPLLGLAVIILIGAS